MMPNFRSLTLIGIAAMILATATLVHAQETSEGENWLSAGQEQQSSHMSSLDSSYPPSPDSFDMPPSDSFDVSSPGASYPQSPDLPSTSPQDSRPSIAKTIHISAKEYPPKAKQIEYQVPQSSASGSPESGVSGTMEAEPVEEAPATQNPPANGPLSRPESPTPADGADGQPLNPMLRWSKQSDGKEVTYTVYMGTSPASMSEEYTVVKNSLILPASLDQATTYYWKVEADNGGETIEGDTWSFTTQESPNRPPGRPENPVPMNGAREIPLAPTLSWSGGDPDGNAVEYTVYLSTNSSPVPLEYKARGKSLSVPVNLSNGVTYYWKVEASDGKLDNVSDSWSFTTQSEPNSPPAKPAGPKPENYAKDQPTNPTLSWDCEEDPDGDPVTYKVYMGPTLNQMTQIYSGPEKSCSAPTSNYGLTNFWKVEASDGGLTNSSDVWSFTTKAQPVWEQPNTVNALIGAIIAVVGGFTANYVRGRKK